MRTFGWFLILFFVGFTAMAALSYPVWLLLSPHFDIKFHRVASRIGMLTLLFSFLWASKRLALRDWRSLGYTLTTGQFLSEAVLGLVLGFATILPVVVIMLGLNLRVMRAGVILDMHTLLVLISSGLLTGLTVALIEETFFRGAMFSGIKREAGALIAIFLSSVLYSSTHFIGRFHIEATAVNAYSGIDLLAGTLASFTHPLQLVDAFLCLSGVGALLALVRLLTGNIAACVGLHAAWVCIITVLRKTSSPNFNHPWQGLLSQFDGVVGWLVFVWTAVMAAALWWFYSRRINGAK